jgi:hypothetical protein
MTERADRRQIWLASLALFVVTAGFTAIRTGRDALYLAGDGLYGLPKAYMATAALSVPQATAMLWLLPRLGTHKTRMLVLGAILAITTAYWALAVPGGSPLMTVFFFVVPLVFSVVFSMVWLLGTELTDHLPRSEAATAFSRLGASSIVGGLAGGVIARSAGPLIGPRSLLFTGLVLTALATAIVVVVHNNQPAPPVRIDPSSVAPNPTMGSSLKQPGVWLLVFIAMAAAITGIFVDFQFYLAAAGESSEDNTVYFANVYLVLSGASLLLQLVVAPWLQRVAGVRRSLLVLPLALVGGASAVFVIGTLLARAGLRVVEGGIKAGVHRTTWEQAFLRYPKENRAATKVLVDGLGARIAEGLAGLVLQLWLILASQGASYSELNAPWIARVLAIWVTLALILSAALWVILSMVLSSSLRRDEIKEEEGFAPRAPLPDS